MKRLLAGIILCCATTAQADIIQITSGSVTVESCAGAFESFGGGFSMSGRIPCPIAWGNWGMFGPFAAGTDIVTSGQQSGNDLSAALITLGSETYDVWLSDLNSEKWSRLMFTGPALTILGAGLYEGSFEFEAVVCGTTIGPGVRPCVVDLPDITGFGSVLFDVRSLFDPGIARTVLWVDNVTYTFEDPEDPAAIPEPGTLAMLALGLAGIGLRRVKP